MEQTAPYLQPAETGKNQMKSIFNLLFLVMVFILPLAFYPGLFNLSFAIKLAVVATAIALGIIALLLGVLSSGEITIPKAKIIWALALLPVAAIISSLFTGNV